MRLPQIAEFIQVLASSHLARDSLGVAHHRELVGEQLKIMIPRTTSTARKSSRLMRLRLGGAAAVCCRLASADRWPHRRRPQRRRRQRRWHDRSRAARRVVSGWLLGSRGASGRLFVSRARRPPLLLGDRSLPGCEPIEVLANGPRVFVPDIRRRTEQPRDDGRKAIGASAGQGWGGLSRPDDALETLRVRRLERTRAANHLVEHHADRPQVGELVHLAVVRRAARERDRAWCRSRCA